MQINIGGICMNSQNSTGLVWSEDNEDGTDSSHSVSKTVQKNKS